MTRVAMAFFLVFMVLVVSTGPAAADGEVGFSTDGTSWAAALPAPLFDPATRWVPGDERTRTFFVRNESSDPATMSVDVLGTTVDSLLETGDLTVSARAGGSPARGVSTSGTHRLVSGVGVRPGGVSRVEVTVDLDPRSGNYSQALALDLDFRVRLTQSGTGVGPGSADDPSSLPDTGAPTPWFVILGLALVGVGSLVASRRPTKEDSYV